METAESTAFLQHQIPKWSSRSGEVFLNPPSCLPSRTCTGARMSMNLRTAFPGGRDRLPSQPCWFAAGIMTPPLHAPVFSRVLFRFNLGDSA